MRLLKRYVFYSCTRKKRKRKENSLLQFLGQNTYFLYFDGQQNISHMNALQGLLIKAHPGTTNKDDWQPRASNTKFIGPLLKFFTLR